MLKNASKPVKAGFLVGSLAVAGFFTLRIGKWLESFGADSNTADNPTLANATMAASAMGSYLPNVEWTVPSMALFTSLLPSLAQYGLLIFLGFVLHYFYSKMFNPRPRSSYLTYNSTPAEIRRDELRGRTYPGFPKGWYFLTYSRDVKNGTVKQVNALGFTFAVFRTECGEIGVIDAYCPHLGANMAVGGKVCGDHLECPFHRWQFDKGGKCAHIPYSEKKIPKQASTRSFPSTEFHDMICIFYDPKGNPPSYTLPIQKDIEEKKLVYRGELDAGVVHMHIQEFSENAADWMHFDPIHSQMMIPFTRYVIPVIWRWLKIHHSPNTVFGRETEEASKHGPADKHFMYFLNHASLRWKDEEIPETGADAAITFAGPGGICWFRFNIPRFGEIVLFHTHLPEGHMDLRVRFHWYADKSVPRLLVWYVVGLWISQWTNDIDIWENKLHYNKPCIVAGDGPIQRVRAWYKQFYYAGENRDVIQIEGKDALNKEEILPKVVDTEPTANALDW